MKLFYLMLVLVTADPFDAASTKMEVLKVFPVPMSESTCRDSTQIQAIIEDYGTGDSGEFLVCAPIDNKAMR